MFLFLWKSLRSWFNLQLKLLLYGPKILPLTQKLLFSKNILFPYFVKIKLSKKLEKNGCRISLELLYDVDVKASIDDLRKTGIIEGQAIDSSVNKNRWQVLDQDLDYFCSSLAKAQVRINHGTSTETVKGQVTKTKRVGDQVFFEAEVSGDPVLLTQIEKKYLHMVSPKVVSDNIVCSILPILVRLLLDNVI